MKLIFISFLAIFSAKIASGADKPVRPFSDTCVYIDYKTITPVSGQPGHWTVSFHYINPGGMHSVAIKCGTTTLLCLNVCAPDSFYVRTVQCATAGGVTLVTYPHANCTGTPCLIVSLPIIFESFFVQQEGKSVKLSWKTSGANDIPGDAFKVKRSHDGATFTDIGTVQIVDQQANYYFTDQLPGSNILYYRICNINKCTPIEKLDFSGGIYHSLSGSELKIEYLPAGAQVMLYDLLGRVLVQTNINRISVGGLSSGSYILLVKAKSGERLYNAQICVNH